MTDLERAARAMQPIIDGRSLDTNWAEILVTLETLIAVALIATLKRPALAAAMLNEGVVPAVEELLTQFAKETRS